MMCLSYDLCSFLQKSKNKVVYFLGLGFFLYLFCTVNYK